MYDYLQDSGETVLLTEFIFSAFEAVDFVTFWSKSDQG